MDAASRKGFGSRVIDGVSPELNGTSESTPEAVLHDHSPMPRATAMDNRFPVAAPRSRG